MFFVLCLKFHKWPVVPWESCLLMIILLNWERQISFSFFQLHFNDRFYMSNFVVVLSQIEPTVYYPSTFCTDFFLECPIHSKKLYWCKRNLLGKKFGDLISRLLLVSSFSSSFPLLFASSMLILC